MTKAGNILVLMVLAVAALAVSPAGAQSNTGVVTKAQQLRTKMQLLAINDEQSMVARMNSGLEWNKLSPDQQEKIREEVLAFMSKSEAEQEKLLMHYQRLIQLGNQQREAYLTRAAWLRVVVESFTPAQRQALESLPPQDRAKQLLDRKTQLIHEGKLPADTVDAAVFPTTMPTR